MCYLFDVQLTRHFEIRLVITIPRKSSIQDMKQGVRYQTDDLATP